MSAINGTARACSQEIRRPASRPTFQTRLATPSGPISASSTRLTLAIDVLGRYVINGERLRQEDFHALDGKSVFPNIAFSRDSFQTLSGALGFKVNVFSRLLIDANLLFALDNNGIRDKLTPLVGFEYTF